MLPCLLCPSFQLPRTFTSFLQIQLSLWARYSPHVGHSLLKPCCLPFVSYTLYCICLYSRFSINFIGFLPLACLLCPSHLACFWPFTLLTTPIASSIFPKKHPGQQNFILQFLLCYILTSLSLIHTQLWQNSNSRFLMFPFRPLQCPPILIFLHCMFCTIAQFTHTFCLFSFQSPSFALSFFAIFSYKSPQVLLSLTANSNIFP